MVAGLPAPARQDRVARNAVADFGSCAHLGIKSNMQGLPLSAIFRRQSDSKGECSSARQLLPVPCLLRLDIRLNGGRSAAAQPVAQAVRVDVDDREQRQQLSQHVSSSCSPDQLCLLDCRGDWSK